MDHKREHRTPPLTRVTGVGRQQVPMDTEKATSKIIGEVDCNVGDRFFKSVICVYKL